jgi:hypothetical protein
LAKKCSTEIQKCAIVDIEGSVMKPKRDGLLKSRPPFYNISKNKDLTGKK